ELVGDDIPGANTAGHRAARHSAVDESIDDAVARLARGQLYQAGASAVDGVLPLQWPGAVGGAAAEGDLGVDGSRRAELELVVRGLEANRQIDVPQLRILVEDATELVLHEGPLFAGIEDEREIEVERAREARLGDVEHEG